MNIIVFGVVTSDGNIIPPFIFLHGPRLNPKASIKCLEEVVLPWIIRVTTGKSYVRHHAPQLEELSLSCHRISATTSPMTSSDITPLIAIPLIIICGAQLSKRPCNTKDKLRVRIMAAFTKLNKVSDRKLCKILKLSRGCDWSKWQFLWINSTYSISRYVILENICNSEV